MTHTSGPWDCPGVNSQEGTRSWKRATITTGGEYGHRIAEVYGQEAMLANARLIAAAPELLAALVDATQAIVNMQAEGESRYHPIVTAAKAAIAKATG